jgi:hypothetical protein
MSELDALDTINEVRRRLDGIAALIGSGSPATIEPAGAAYLAAVLREESERLNAATDALDSAVRAKD